MDPRDDWILKVFRGRTATTASSSGSSSGSVGEGERQTPPLVVVNALRAPLPPVAAPPPPAAAANGSGERGAPRGESHVSIAAAATGGGGAGAEGGRNASWLNPLSWFASSSVPRPVGLSPPLPPPRPSPPRPSLPPRVVVRVVYAAAAPDMVEHLAVAAERRDGEGVRGPVASSDGTDASVGGGGASGCGGGGVCGEGGESSDRVVLLRSEVRVLQGSSSGRAVAACAQGAAPGESARVMQMQLQVRLTAVDDTSTR